MRFQESEKGIVVLLRKVKSTLGVAAVLKPDDLFRARRCIIVALGFRRKGKVILGAVEEKNRNAFQVDEGLGYVDFERIEPGHRSTYDDTG